MIITQMYGASIPAAMLLLLNKTSLISTLLVSKILHIKISLWCLNGQLGMRHVKKQLKTKQLSHVRGIVTAKTFKSRRGIFASASKVTKGTHTSLVVAKVRIIHL